MYILGLCGSLRRGSYNRGLLRAAEEVAPEGVDYVTFDLVEIPPFNADVEAHGDPAPVAALKEAIREADALLIATPEYNRGTSGVLKNAIDWASRPAAASVLTGKPVAIMGAGGRGGTARAQAQLRDALAFPRADVLDAPEVKVARAWEHFDENGELVDLEVREQVRDLVVALRERVMVTVHV